MEPLPPYDPDGALQLMSTIVTFAMERFERVYTCTHCAAATYLSRNYMELPEWVLIPEVAHHALLER